MDIHQQNETVLSHPAVRKKENTVVDGRKGSQSAFVEGTYSGSCAVSSSKAICQISRYVYLSSEPEPGQKVVCNGQ